MADYGLNDANFPAWEGMCTQLAEVSSRRDSATSLATYDGSETTSFYAGPPTPTESSYCETFQDLGSISSHLYPGLSPMAYIDYDNIPADYETALPQSWIAPTMIQSMARHAPTLKPSPMPDAPKAVYRQCGSKASHFFEAEAPVAVKKESCEKTLICIPKLEPEFGEDLSQWAYPDAALIPSTAGYESPQSQWSDVAQFCFPQLPLSPLATDSSLQETNLDEDCSIGDYDIIDSLPQSSESAGGSPCQPRRSGSTKKPAKFGRSTRMVTRSSQNQVADTQHRRDVPSLRYFCYEICTLLPKNLNDGVELRKDGKWYCTKSFQRPEHLTRHKTTDRHTLTDPSDTRQGAEVAKIKAKDEARRYFCGLAGCAKSREPKPGTTVTGFGTRKDNLEDHIIKTHCTPSEHGKVSERAPNKKNTRVSRAVARKLGWDEYYERGHRKMHATEIKKRWDAALPAGETEAVRQISEYFCQHELRWTQALIRQTVNSGRLYDALRRRGFALEASDRTRVGKKKRRCEILQRGAVAC